MDLTELDRIAGDLFLKGLAESTQRVYRSGQRRYINFCSKSGLTAVPTTEKTLVYFVAKLAKDGLKFRTMKVYLSAVRFLHIKEGREDSFRGTLSTLQYTLQGVKREEGSGGSTSRVRLPIGPSILKKIKTVWQNQGPNPDKVMLWAAVCLGFFGFLRAGEMTVPSDSDFDPATHLTRKDIAVDNPEKPEVLRVTIKQSKTDPFRKGVDLFIGKTDRELCPPGLSGGEGITPRAVVSVQRWSLFDKITAVREALQAAGLHESRYCGHSFRIGAETAGAWRTQ